jgi:hypothetical protein
LLCDYDGGDTWRGNSHAGTECNAQARGDLEARASDPNDWDRWPESIVIHRLVALFRRNEYPGEKLFLELGTIHCDYVRARHSGDPAAGELRAELKTMQGAFDKAVGGITAEHWCTYIEAGMLGTAKPYLHIYMNDYEDVATPPISRILGTINELCDRIGDSVEKRHHSDLMGTLCACATDALGLLDFVAKGNEIGKPVDREYVNAQLDRIDERAGNAGAAVRRAARAASQLIYAKSMVLSLLAISATTAVISLVLNVIAPAPWAISLAVAILMGGVGATLSALSRMETAEHVLIDSGLHGYRLFGFLRPVVGALFGGAVFLVVAGGMSTINDPRQADSILFYGGLGLLAGFVEGFAANVLNVAAKIAGRPQGS